MFRKGAGGGERREASLSRSGNWVKLVVIEVQLGPMQPEGRAG